MYYGHESWIALLIFGGMFAVRALTSQRRRGASGRPSNQQSSLTSPGRRPPADQPVGAVSTTFTGTAPGWFADPFARHQHRYWSGTEWSEHVSDDGVPGTDPPPGRGRRGAA
jgi:hypothetical protein